MDVRIAAAAAALALAAAGCGDTADEDRIDTAQEYCEALVAEGARVAAECLEYTPDMAALVVAFEYGFHCDVLDGAGVAYDASKGEACLAALQGWSCSQYFWLGAPPPDCYDAFDGQVAEGGACTSPWQCQSLRCDFDACDVPGTCAPAAAPGEACDRSTPCRPGSSCTDVGGALTCVAWETPPAPVGEGADCSAAPCADAFRCDGDQTPSTCVARLSDGEPCSSSEECRWGSDCESTPDGSFCDREPRPGDGCEPGSHECVSGAYCTDAGTCAAYPHVAGDCGVTAAGEDVPCIDGWCDAEGDGTCKAFLPAGGDCTRYEQCGFEAACVDGTCVPNYCGFN